ncbi:MAG: acyl-ACP--UDP-N-acetylglucosamine O-acyltransferase [Bacteroidaceae bacterium]|nr:acyl-ACP--UDP-N-acetylglucosamine O-acyltransferase [Bacteroidaceae bacterium]MBR5002595.1 acyl-ACP--UDP-N-acetylglucosamine O-acyltransferase [Bacteroidaceae bacterium]
MENFSYIHPDAKIGKDVTISPFVTIYEDVVIGDGTYIHPNVTLYPGARIGKNCKIFPGVTVAAVPQDLKFNGEYTTAEIGDNTTLRECVTVHRGTASKGRTVVGNNCLLMAYCHVAHDCELGNNLIISNATQLAGEVVIDDNTVIGGGTLVHQFTHIGSYAMIQGGTPVNKDIPPYVMAARSPISFVGLNIVGLRRRGFTNEQIATLQEIYRRIFNSDSNMTDALNAIEAEIPASPERDYVLSFIRNSSRGVIKGLR